MNKSILLFISFVSICFSQPHWEINIDQLNQNAQVGDIVSQSILSELYRTGFGKCQKDYTKAIFWADKAIAGGDTTGVAFYSKGCLLENGSGVVKDSNLAQVYYKKALSGLIYSSQQGFLPAINNLAMLYYFGRGVKPDTIRAIELWNSAAEQGFYLAEYALSLSYCHGLGLQKNDKKAFDLMSKSANHGYAYAQWIVGIYYLNGFGVKKDSFKAFDCFLKAANMGCDTAKIFVGKCYLSGIGVKKEPSRAIPFLLSSSNMLAAQQVLGYCYYNGVGVEQDYKEAVEWFKKAIKNGDSEARINLGVCYENGFGVPADSCMAFSLYMDANRNKCIPAKYKIGRCYKYGIGLHKDSVEAQRWILSAAEDGDAEAQRIIGSMYFNGESVESNIFTALEWYEKGAKNDSLARQYMIYCNSIINSKYTVPTSLRIKRFYLGMSIKEALYNINTNYSEELGVPVISKYRGSEKGVAYEIKTAKGARYLFDSSYLLNNIYWPAELTNHLFNVEDLSAEQFAQEMINSYNVSEMNYKTDVTSSIFGSSLSGYWESTTADGVRLRVSGPSQAYFMGLPVSSDGKGVYLDRVPTKLERTFD